MKPINQAINEYLNHCEFQRKLNAKTIKAYRIDLNHFESYLCCGEYELTRESLARYIELLNQQYKPRSVKRII